MNNEENAEYVLIPFPEFELLKKEVEKLRNKISELLAEKDELQHIICKNIERAYLISFGSLEYKIYMLQCKNSRLRRKIDLVQAKKNRREKIDASEIDEILDREFADFLRRVDELLKKVSDALGYQEGEILSENEKTELKKLYRSIVKALHPDLHPDATPAQLNLFRKAVEAYENGDVEALRIISDMISEPPEYEASESGISALKAEKERLSETVESLRKQIEKIKSEYPYSEKETLKSPEKIAEKKAMLQKLLEDTQEFNKYYSEKLNELLRESE